MQATAPTSAPAGPHQSSSGATVHTVIFAILSVIIEHIQNKCQFMKNSPYEGQNGITLGIYISLFLYAMPLLAEFGCKISDGPLLLLIKRFSPILGTFVVIMHIFLLSPIFGFITLALWGMFLVGALLRSIQEMMQIYQCLLDMLSKISEEINAYFHSTSKTTRKYLQEEDDELPQ